MIENNLKETTSMKWYAVRVQNNQEKGVLERIRSEIKYLNLESKLGRAIIPTEKVLTIKNGKKYLREKTTYPGYIFIETSIQGELSNILKGIKGASGFVRTRSGDVTPMKEYEVKKILDEQEVSNNIDLSKIYTVGEEVEIVDGPFSSFSGKITGIDLGKERLKIGVSIFGRITEVDLTFLQVKKKNG
jgi:transcriptional antiterminator NusG